MTHQAKRWDLCARIRGGSRTEAAPATRVASATGSTRPNGQNLGSVAGERGCPLLRSAAPALTEDMLCASPSACGACERPADEPCSIRMILLHRCRANKVFLFYSSREHPSCCASSIETKVVDIADKKEAWVTPVTELLFRTLEGRRGRCVLQGGTGGPATGTSVRCALQIPAIRARPVCAGVIQA